MPRQSHLWVHGLIASCEEFALTAEDSVQRTEWITHREHPRRGCDQRVHRIRVTLVTPRGPEPGPRLTHDDDHQLALPSGGNEYGKGSSWKSYGGCCRFIRTGQDSRILLRCP